MHAERVPVVYQMSGGLLTRKGYWLEVLGGAQRGQGTSINHHCGSDKALPAGSRVSVTEGFEWLKRQAGQCVHSMGPCWAQNNFNI